jgi:hypothetical protein
MLDDEIVEKDIESVVKTFNYGARLSLIKKQMELTKTLTLLRETALEIEKAIKIAIINASPAMIPNYRRINGQWDRPKLERTTVEELWKSIGEDVRTSLLSTWGISEQDFEDVCADDLYLMTEPGKLIVHPDTQQDERSSPVDKIFRIRLINRFPELVNRTVIEKLIDHLL